MSRQTQGGTAFVLEGPCKILDFYLAKVLQGLFCCPGKGVIKMERKNNADVINLADLSTGELDRIAQEAYAEMMFLIKVGEVPGREYYEASVLYARASAECYRRKSIAEMMQRYNQVSDVFGLDAADDLVK